MTRPPIAGALVLLLLAVALGGCLGDGGSSLGTSTHERNVCRDTVSVRTGTVTPDETLAVEQRASMDSSDVKLEYEGDPHLGTIHLTLAHEGDEVWRHEVTGVGNSFTTQRSDLPAGNYTLTASTDDGYSEARLELHITWGTGSCG